MTPAPHKVFLSCTGVGLHRGGHETFASECFEGLRGTPGLDIKLIKATPPTHPDERKVACLNRHGFLARTLASLTRRSGYAIEQNSSVPAIVRLIRRERPDVFFTSEVNLLSRLYALRNTFPDPPALILSNGAPYAGPFRHLHQVQQVTPYYHELATRAGDPPELHSLVPYGFTIPQGEITSDPAQKLSLRQKLNLPPNRPILISVGWVSPTHKRMDHLVREVALLPADARPFVLMLGRMDDSTTIIQNLAQDFLGDANFTIRSAPYEQIRDYYLASDLFALCSLGEGFGRVYVEALAEGLPVIAHDQSVMRYVLDDVGFYANMDTTGDLARTLTQVLALPPSLDAANARRKSVRDRFSWPALQPQYLNMFHRAVAFRTLHPDG